jgi:hypothetical protein
MRRIDLLAPEAFAEGFGLQTPMVTGQMNVVRYYPYFSRALEVVKKLIADSGQCAHVRFACVCVHACVRAWDDEKLIADT